MTQSTNFLSIINSEEKHSDEVILNLKLAINAFTGAVLSAMRAHIASVRRGETTPANATEPGAAASIHGEPTIDQANAIHNAEQGDQLASYLTKISGHDETMKPLQVAQICDGIRHTLYNQLEGFVDIAAPKEGLLGPTKKGALPNFDQPMSLADMIDFIISRSGTVDEAMVKRGAALTEDPEDFVRQALKEAGERDARRMMLLKPEILVEVSGFTDSGEGMNYDEDAFTGLPVQVQLNIATKVANGLNREYKRIYPVAIRTGDLEQMNTLKLIKANYNEVNDWIKDFTRTHRTAQDAA